MGQHRHHHHDGNSHGHAGGGAPFRWSIALNSALTTLQLVVGAASGSLALIGDALHNLGDVVGLALAWGAERLSRRPGRGRYTYGYGRSTQLAALINGLLIFGAGGVLILEAIQRLIQPQPLNAQPVVWAAAAGIAINLLSARLFGLDHHHQHDLNRRAAMLHLLSDAAVSLAVLFSALTVAATGWMRLDALVAISVGAAVIWSARGLLREAIALSLDAAPGHVDLTAVEAALEDLPGVQQVEELHVWGLSTSHTALTAHLRLDGNQLVAEGLSRDQLLALARQRLLALGIRKTTLQLEGAPPH